MRTGRPGSPPLVAGQIARIHTDLSVLWALLDAYEHQIDRVSPDAEVTISTPLVPGRSFPGRVTYIADQVDPQLRTVRVRVEVDNTAGLLRPNMFIEGTLHLRDPGDPRMVVPEEAVQLLEGSHVVFVKAELTRGAGGHQHVH
ncbi:MAG: efflux RND transporter periplasmic adaptor subunit [bacterium]